MSQRSAPVELRIAARAACLKAAARRVWLLDVEVDAEQQERPKNDG
jgi:hypothetical protein